MSAASPPIAPAADSDGRAMIDLDDLRESLRALMWRRMGITRDASGMADAATQVGTMAARIATCGPPRAALVTVEPSEFGRR